MMEILGAFPNLENDKHFKITSKRDQSYNCIAWAAIKDDIIWWPHDKPIDGTDWPYGLERINTLEVFTNLFGNMGYEICESSDYEVGFQKIAIYHNPDTKKCTHASRLRSDGFWTSKLGPEQDIIHGDPSSVEGEYYGIVARLMKRKNPEFKKSKK